MFEEKIRKLGELKANWDSYGAPPIGPAAMEAVLEVQITPTNTGGILVSWQNELAWVEFASDGRLIDGEVVKPALDFSWGAGKVPNPEQARTMLEGGL